MSFLQSDPRNTGIARVAAAMLLALMMVLMFVSSWDDTATSDDSVALISGYSYLRTQEYRLAPQNPPLSEDLAALPLLFMNLKEPWDTKDWIVDKEPDTLGRIFLYQIGNDADAMLRAARAPMILFSVVFGWILFSWTLKNYGARVALLTLFLYTFSPTVIAHSRFVATDLGAVAGFFIGVTAFLRSLRSPGKLNTLLAGLALGFALLVKFSTIALLPIFFILAMVWALTQKEASVPELRAPRVDFRRVGRFLAHTAAVVAIGFAVVYVVYLHHVWKFAPEVQRDVAALYRNLYHLGGSSGTLVSWSSDKPFLQPWSQYFLGLLVALKASRYGQPVFFLGKSYMTGLRAYFPVAYLLKEPLALHLMTLVAIVSTFLLWKPSIREWGQGALTRWVSKHFTEFAFLVVLVIYWTALIRSHMNIGVRHLLPAFPFMFILISRQVVDFIDWVGRQKKRTALLARATLGVLLAWQAFTVLYVHPAYLAYFNELGGGPEGGWKYLNDSNLDWGQDVKRLAQFMDQQGAKEIHTDFFGPADPTYYFHEKYKGGIGCAVPPKGWVAVSAMLYPGAPWNQECDYRRYLPIESVKAKIGYSIFVFYVD